MLNTMSAGTQCAAFVAAAADELERTPGPGLCGAVAPVASGVAAGDDAAAGVVGVTAGDGAAHALPYAAGGNASGVRIATADDREAGSAPAGAPGWAPVNCQ